LRATCRHPPAMRAAEYKSSFNQGRDYGDALGRSQNLFGNALVRRRHDLVEDLGSRFRPAGGAFRSKRSSCKRENKNGEKHGSQGSLHKLLGTIVNARQQLTREMLENDEGLDTVTLVTVPNPRLPGSVVGE